MQGSYWIAVKKAGSKQHDKTAILIRKNKTQNIYICVYIVVKLLCRQRLEAPCSCSIRQTPGGFSPSMLRRCYLQRDSPSLPPGLLFCVTNRYFSSPESQGWHLCLSIPRCRLRQVPLQHGFVLTYGVTQAQSGQA